MARTIQSDGACFIYVDSAATDVPILLGTCTDKPQFDEGARVHRVFGDENGGQEGPEMDAQLLGSVHMINFTLINFDRAVFKVISTKHRNLVLVGAAPEPGVFMSGNGKFQFWFVTRDKNGAITSGPDGIINLRHYKNVWPLQAIRWEMGVIAKQIPMGLEAHVDPATGLYYDLDATGLANPGF